MNDPAQFVLAALSGFQEKFSGLHKAQTTQLHSQRDPGLERVSIFCFLSFFLFFF